MDAVQTPTPIKARRRPWYLSRLHVLWLLFFVLPVAARASLYAIEDHPDSFASADWSTTHLLPPAASDPEARVLVFAARNGTWRSIFAVHTWIVVKPQNGPYTRYEVTGFGMPVRINARPPDAHWYGYVPAVIADVRGPLAAQAIPKIEDAVRSYVYAKRGDYRIWPGPNSNTFIATVLRAVPELAVALPSTAIGKDFRADYSVFGPTPSRTGYELEIFGLLGAKAAWVEGIEINLFTLVLGIDLRHPALKLPGIGRVGLDGMMTPANAR
jgi:hypothetical protein